MRRRKQREIEYCNIDLNKSDPERYINRIKTAIREYHSKYFYFERPPPRIIASVNVQVEVSSYLHLLAERKEIDLIILSVGQAGLVDAAEAMSFVEDFTVLWLVVDRRQVESPYWLA